MSTSRRPDGEALDLLARQVEGILFVSAEPVRVDAIASALGETPKAVRDAIARVDASLAGSGLTLLRAAGGWQMATSPDVADAITSYQGTLASSRVRLSKAAFETLSVIAYNQPVTRSEMEEIRTVRCDRVVDTLMKHGLVRVAGRKKSVGSPLLYRTTDRFLELFGLDSIASLPTLEELQETYVKEGDEWSDDDEAE